MKSFGPWLVLGTLSCVLPAATFNVPAPASLSLTSAPGGMRIIYRGATNFLYSIHATSNLVNWATLSSGVATNRVMTFTDSQSTNRPARFYRAVSMPTPLMYQGTFSGSETGAFVLLARTNNTTVFMGVNLTPAHRRGEYIDSMVAQDDGSACGAFIAGAPGCLLLTLSNSISGKFTNSSQATGTVSGIQRANVGSYSGLGGIYSGTVSAPHSGNAKILLSPDGSFAFYRQDSATGKNSGAVSFLPPNGIVDAYLDGSVVLHVQGSYNRVNRRFSLTIHELDGLISTVTLNLSEPMF
jgi:hypothetical protein